MGLALGGIWWAASRVWNPPVTAAIVVGADLVMTGLLHFDGLVDCADGLLPHLDRERRLAAMADPHTGAFGVGAGAVVLLARWAALDVLRPAVLLVGGVWCLSRTGMAIVARSQPYARPEGGLASAFSGPSGPMAPALVTGVAAAVGLACGWRPLAGGVSVAAGAGVAAAVVVLARRRIGGYTGDVLGASGILLETASLIVASAKW
jgi:adenosylcobinamide-GDP ribazoletransferase